MSTERVVAWGQELRAGHQRLQRALDAARESVEDGTGVQVTARDLRLHCLAFCTALTSHHVSEDTTLFPRVLAEHPDLAPTVAKLLEDHQLIARLVADVEHAVSTAENPESLLGHLTGIAAIVESHFRFEERTLVGLLDSIQDESVSTTELFGRFT